MAYQNDPQKVLIPECRLSYVNLVTPRASIQGGDEKYSATLLIPKSATTVKADIDQSIERRENAVNRIWGGKRPPELQSVVHDGDGVRPSGEPFGEECKGHWVLTASTKWPQVVGRDNLTVELQPTDIYSGMCGAVTVRFFGYSNSGSRRDCGLGNVMKTRDGEPLAGGASAAVDFAGIGVFRSNSGNQPNHRTADVLMRHLSIDIETYSSVPIRDAGAYKYTKAPTLKYCCSLTVSMARRLRLLI